jgi:beta-galactosidase
MTIKTLVASLAIATCSLCIGTAAETVRVKVNSGVPQLVVDGKAVRARVFFGIPGARPKAIMPESQLFTFEFQPLENEPARATMHLRFGETPGQVILDDIQVQDLTSGTETISLCDFEQGKAVFDRDWVVWPPGEENTVGNVQIVAGAGRDGSNGLCVALQKPTHGSWPDFHIYHRANLALNRDHRYRVSLWIRSEQKRNLALAFYRPGEHFTYLGGPPSCFESQIKLAADVHVDLVSFPLRMPWPRSGKTVDWTSVERQCQAVIDANPRALLLPRVWMGPPHWWLEEHPDDRMVWDKEPTQHSDVVVASSVWREEAAGHLTALIEHLESKFGAHMAGYHPTGQNTGEWFYQNTWGPALNGYSASSRRAWREWLQERYRDDAGLQAAWSDPLATLDAAEVPHPEARRGSPYGLLRDPRHERSLLDFAQFQQDMMADCVCHFAKTVRQATRGDKLVVFFYGYSFEFAAIRDGAAVAGHYGLRRVLQSPDVDMLCSPISYFDRALGGSGPAMTAAESVALAGKMWLVEDDTRTYLGTGDFPGWQDGVDNLEDTNALLLRNTGQCALRNFATWWMDLGGTGWFDDARMWVEMERLQRLDQLLLETPRPFRPEVAAVVDEKSMICTAGGSSRLTRPLVYEARRPLGRMGAAYGQYLLDDVIAGRTKDKM